jgi:hypothetical protein
MRGGIYLQIGETLQGLVWACTVFLSIAIVTISGCVSSDPNPEPVTAPPMTRPRTPPATPPESPPQSDRAGDAQEVEPPPLPEGSGQTAWADGFTGQLVLGLDGEVYLPYRAATINRVQTVLKERGLYSGPVNGVLDPPTMKSLYAFQEANYYLQRCGVPTPRTRKLLEQGSHTDVPS